MRATPWLLAIIIFYGAATAWPRGASWDAAVFLGVLERSPSVLPSSVVPAAALALLADERCRSIGGCALSLCSASAQTDPRLEILARTSILAGGLGADTTLRAPDLRPGAVPCDVAGLVSLSGRARARTATGLALLSLTPSPRPSGVAPPSSMGRGPLADDGAGPFHGDGGRAGRVVVPHALRVERLGVGPDGGRQLLGVHV